MRQLRGVRYNWKREEYPEMHFPDGQQIGFIAQEVEKRVPEVVATNDDGYKSLAYDRLTAVLTEAVKEQQEQIDRQQGIIKQQAAELDSIKAILLDLTASVNALRK